MLSESGARNINHVIEAFPVAQSMWVVTEYCAGGSVSTLMRPTAPAGLQEKWIVPILREVAEALYCVHRQGIIHRDVKGGNVLITEEGKVQLCDFGVAGIIDTKLDKRSTFIGTLHWMAPELFDNSASYGTEVDIWAFGALAYELAVGHPPNIDTGTDLDWLGSRLNDHSPRLEGDKYSAGLKDIVALCLQHDVTKRPTIEDVQKHSYIFATEDEFPAASLSHLVRAFKLWEAQGGYRSSLFAPGGAPGPESINADSGDDDDDEWNFSTTAALEAQIVHGYHEEVAYDAYEPAVNLDQQTFDDATLQPKSRARRQPPPNLPIVKAPIERLFDSNTLSGYEDISKLYYGDFQLESVRDLPLRDNSNVTSNIRESLIDLDASLDGADLCQFTEFNTGMYMYNQGGSHIQDLLSEPVYTNTYRRTQDWKFPTITTPESNLNMASRQLKSRQSIESLIDVDLSYSATETGRGTFVSPQSSAAGATFLITKPAHPQALNNSVIGQNQHVQRFSLSDFADTDPEESASSSPNNATCYGTVTKVLKHAEHLGDNLVPRTVSLPPLPDVPAVDVMTGQADQGDVKEELRRLTSSLAAHVTHANAYLTNCLFDGRV
jgi:serine/threonine protein kinase